MPPLSTWYAPKRLIVAWARESSMSGAWQWRATLTRANAQPALGFYARDERSAAYLPFALCVLSFRDGLVSDVTAFIVRSIDSVEPEAYERFPEQPMDPLRFQGAFGRFGLPDRLELQP
jgi:hypothetical protein